MQLEMDQINHAVEVVLQKEIKYCNLTGKISFQSLLDTLRTCFLKFDEKYVQYEDDEGDLVLMNTTEELAMALKLSPRIIRVALRMVSENKEVIPDKLTRNNFAKKSSEKENHAFKRKLENLEVEEFAEKLQIKDENERNKKFRAVAKTAHLKLPSDGIWPVEIVRIFVDGNNMMFLTSGLRNLTLQKRFNQTEQALATIVETFSAHVTITSVLLFDGTKTNSSKTLPNGSSITVTSARPQFPTTDQALIHWAKNNPNDVKNSLVVTSDRALSGELKLYGMELVKPSEWLNFVVRLVLGNLESLSYEKWIDEKIIVK